MHRSEKVQGITTYLFAKLRDDIYYSFLVIYYLRTHSYYPTFASLLGPLLRFIPLFFIAFMSNISHKNIISTWTNKDYKISQLYNHVL